MSGRQQGNSTREDDGISLHTLNGDGKKKAEEVGYGDEI
jgi:hypothetical protein